MREEPTPQLRISAWAIRNPIPVAVFFLALLIWGVFSYFQLPVKNFPNISFPAVSVTVVRNGAAPAEMESQVTRPIENALTNLSDVDGMRTTVSQGVSTTIIQFAIGTDLQRATEQVRAAVDQARSNLPRDVEPPLVQRIEFEDQPIVSYAISAPAMSQSELSWFIDDTIGRRLLAAPGVARVDRVGGVNREINVIIDPVRMAAQGLTANQINDALSIYSLDAPGGRVEVGGREQTLRVLGAATNVDQVRELNISAGGGRSVRLGDVADVGDGAAEPRTLALLDGRPVVGFQVVKTKDSSDVAVEEASQRVLDQIVREHPGVRV